MSTVTRIAKRRQKEMDAALASAAEAALQEVNNNPEQIELAIEKAAEDTLNWNQIVIAPMESKDIPIEYFIKNVFPTLYLDPSFQVEKTRWTVDKEQAYIVNLFLGLARSPLSIAGILQGDAAMRKHFQIPIQKGFTAATADGNNRGWATVRFVNNEFPIEYNSPCGRFNLNGTFSQLPKGFQKMFLSKTITLHVYEVRKLITLSELFIGLNDGEPLNKQEIRNAYIGDPAKSVRKATRKLTAAMQPFSFGGALDSIATNDRRAGDEFLAQWLCRLNLPVRSTKNVNHEALTEMYRTNNVDATIYPLLRQHVDLVASSFSYASANSMVAGVEENMTKSRLANYMILLDLILTSGYTISNVGVIFEWFMETEPERWLKEPSQAVITAQVKKAKGKKEKAEATLKALKDRYSEWCRQALTNSSKVKKRTALIQEDLDKVIAEWQSSGVIE